jgi:hypothetical protein
MDLLHGLGYAFLMKWVQSLLRLFLVCFTVNALGHTAEKEEQLALANQGLSEYHSSVLSGGDSAASFVLPVPQRIPDLGLDRDQMLQLKLLDRANQLITRFQLPLEMAGFTTHLRNDEEFSLYQGRKPGQAGVLLNSHFWIHDGYYASDAYLVYVLFRATADYDYRRHFDAEHCAWLVETDAEPLRATLTVLKGSVDTTAAMWLHSDNQPTDRSEEFRRSIDPSGNPVKILQVLTRYALQAIEQRAADDWAVSHYHKVFKEPETSLIKHRVNERERALAWDFSRAVSAMTLPDRMAFRQVLKSPFRYSETSNACCVSGERHFSRRQ